VFDVAFSELIVIAVVALIVIGPEKLPKVARTLGLLAGRMQRYVANVKSDIEREMQFEDLQKIQHEIRQGVMQARVEVDQAGKTLSNEVAALERNMEAIGEASVAVEHPAELPTETASIEASAINSAVPETPALTSSSPSEDFRPKSQQ